MQVFEPDRNIHLHAQQYSIISIPLSEPRIHHHTQQHPIICIPQSSSFIASRLNMHSDSNTWKYIHLIDRKYVVITYVLKRWSPHTQFLVGFQMLPQELSQLLTSDTPLPYSQWKVSVSEGASTVMNITTFSSSFYLLSSNSHCRFAPPYFARRIEIFSRRPTWDCPTGQTPSIPAATNFVIQKLRPMQMI